MNYMWDNIFRKSHGPKDTQEVLAQNFIFEDLSKKELSFVSTLVHNRRYKAGEYIFRQGELGVGMYILLSGQIDVTVEDQSLDSISEAVFVTKLEPGDFFGEIGLVEESERRTANAVAHNEVQVLGFFKPDLSELVERNPIAGVKVFKKLACILGRRLKETSLKVTELKREMGRTRK